MGQPARQQARWFRHANAVNPPEKLRRWLTDGASLTLKLMAHSSRFCVKPLRQGRALALSDEAHAIGLPRRRQVHERDVLLCCDDVAVVFAHTVVPMTANAADWPFFRTLGSRSLGSALFGDPRVSRGALQFARLPSRHPLVRRVGGTLSSALAAAPVYARRCLFRRRQGVLLVTELFLPAITVLKPVQGQQAYVRRAPSQWKRRRPAGSSIWKGQAVSATANRSISSNND